jgi:hypothetical protein
MWVTLLCILIVYEDLSQVRLLNWKTSLREFFVLRVVSVTLFEIFANYSRDKVSLVAMQLDSCTKAVQLRTSRINKRNYARPLPCTEIVCNYSLKHDI